MNAICFFMNKFEDVMERQGMHKLRHIRKNMYLKGNLRNHTQRNKTLSTRYTLKEKNIYYLVFVSNRLNKGYVFLWYITTQVKAVELIMIGLARAKMLYYSLVPKDKCITNFISSLFKGTHTVCVVHYSLNIL